MENDFDKGKIFQKDGGCSVAMFDYPRVSNKFILGPLGTSPPPTPKKKTWELNMAILTDSMAIALSTDRVGP